MTSSSVSSSGSGSSDDDECGAAATARTAPPPPPPPLPLPPAGDPAQPADLGGSLELAQICHFCATFRAPLKLVVFTRTDLQAALLDAANPNEKQLALLAELHFKLTRDQTGVKLEKMIQDWEKAVARKLAENWQLEFSFNPMANTSYAELSVHDRIRILNALCLWKVESCVEIRKYIMTIQKDDTKAFDRLRGSEIGTDDSGVSYWYFDDGCWVYAEDMPRWKLERRDPQYAAEFANGKRIRLSINFNAGAAIAGDATVDLKQLSVDSAKRGSKDALKTTADGQPEEQPEKTPSVAAVAVSDAKSTEDDPVKTEKKHEAEEPRELSAVLTESAVRAPSVVKEDTLPASRKMDINMICGSPSSDDLSAKSEVGGVPASSSSATHVEKQEAGISNGDIKVETGQEPQYMDELGKELSQATTIATTTTAAMEDTKPLESICKTETKENLYKNSSLRDSPTELSQRRDSAVAVAKKRVIIDDDNTESSDSDTIAAVTSKTISTTTTTTTVKTTTTTHSKETHVSFSASPVKKKQRTERVEKPSAISVVVATTATVEIATATPASKSSVKAVAAAAAAASSDKAAVAAATTAKLVANAASGRVSDATSDAVENFDINCECCQKDYDMRYLDPPLVERPAGDWRCFECLVNDARGWPRRRKPTASPTAKAELADEKSKSSKKSSSGSSSAKRSRPSSSSRLSSSKASSASGSKRKKSSGNSTSTSKKSSSSSRKKHKRKKSSSSSSHSHHRSSSSSHHRRRYHHEYSKLLAAFQARNKERAAIEALRIEDANRHSIELLESPTSWRVVSSTVESLRTLIETLAGGSLEQERLRSRLISVLKVQEKLEEERIKRQELAWQLLPRRQSSRIAIGKMRNQSSGSDDDSADVLSDDDEEDVGGGASGRRRRGSQRSVRSRAAADSTGMDSRQQLALDRASRARRRQLHDGASGQAEDATEDDESSSAVALGEWINWSILKSTKRKLSTLCLAAVSRLLKEEISELFSRPVDPEFDGCPDYFAVISDPMDLGTIRKRLQAGSYKTWEAFKADVELVWSNCREFNGVDTVIAQYAETLEAMFAQMSKAAEKRGVRSMVDDDSGDVGVESNDDDDDDDELHSSSAESKAESKTSVNKEWSESSESESSGSSDVSDASSDHRPKARTTPRSRPSRGASNKRTRTLPSPASTTAAARSFRTRGRACARKWNSDDDDDEESSAASSDASDESDRPMKRKAAASTRATRASTGRQATPTSNPNSRAPRTASPQAAAPRRVLRDKENVPSSPPPPPPPAQTPVTLKSSVIEKSPRPPTTAGAVTRVSRLRVSDGSSSSDSDDEEDKASSSSSSSSSSDDSDDSDSDDGSDADLRSAPLQHKASSEALPPPPPPPAAADPVATPSSESLLQRMPPPPPPPSPPSAAAPLSDAMPPPPPSEKKRTPLAKGKLRGTPATAAARSGTKASPRVAALKLDHIGESGTSGSAYTNSPTLLNSYLSPSSSSSSYFSSSADSDSSDSSDSDDGSE